MRLPGSEKVIVGYDLGNKYAQISCYVTGSEEEIRTLSSVAGSSVYTIPLALSKRQGVNQWFYGSEAIRYAGEEEGILVENLLKLARDGEPVQIDGAPIDPVALLTLFLKRSLGLLSQVTNTERIGALMITCEELDHRMLEVLTAATEGLHLKTDQICFQSHVESFYYYNLYQPEELWRHKTILCEYGDASIRTYCMECNRHTTPVVAYMEEREFPFPVPESDEKMQEIAKKLCENQMISSVYLIGEAFSRDWMKESLRYLCKGRRVFQGNNLFSKGACYGMMERLTPGETGKNHVFLGKDKLKSNIGMKVLRQGEESYQALLDAGINWYEAKNTMEFYLLEGRAVEILITSLTGKGNRIARIVPEELQEGIIRLRISVEMRDDTHLKADTVGQSPLFSDLCESTVCCHLIEGLLHGIS
jgi:hypothetical protein